MSLFWSLRGTKWHGRAYWKTRSGSIFLNSLYRDFGDDFGKFIAELTCVMFHEYLHLFFKFELGKYQNSCKTIITPLSEVLTNEMAKDDEFVSQIVDDFMDIHSSLRTAIESQDMIVENEPQIDEPIFSY